MSMADRSGFDEFVAHRSPALLRTAYLLTGDHALAEDLLQTALAKCWFAWGRIDGPPEPYVRRALATTYATWWRRKWRGERPTGTLPESSAEPRHAVEDRDALWRALGTLPRRQRAVVVLRYYEDLSEAETAAALGISTGTVKSQAARALAALRRDGDLLRTIGGGQ
jgi:RNA polymerase sigma-70 factor (sigma-E family)